ncbi:MAG: sulfate reduction electron transfer complex DsrMKJOP subunit DsrJ [Deltaproteobacteria bacterium]|nr:sulfate reduction electron transfer complex DsrMKJOP subunit DsrJ [Deltaproteobacteria bacterium]
MYDGKKIIPGLILFLGIVTYPIWHNTVSGKIDYVPKPKIPADKKECVEPKALIRVNHKDLLDDWKMSVVRSGIRTYQASNKKIYTMSLTRTCMNCHQDRKEFCDQCHNYMGVKNKCWDCHMYPKELKAEVK